MPYGAETWQLKKSQNKLLATEMHFWRYAGEKPATGKVIKEGIRTQMEAKTIINKLHKKLIWYDQSKQWEMKDYPE